MSDNVHSLETQRALAALSGPISKLVGAAAALEVARAFLQVQGTTAALGDRFDPVATARDLVQHRVDHHTAYGTSWKDADVTTVATLLAFTWVDACSKDKDVDADDPDADLSGKAPDADF